MVRFALNATAFLMDCVNVYETVHVERIVLDLESEAMRGPGFIPTGGNIFLTLIYTILPDLTE